MARRQLAAVVLGVAVLVSGQMAWGGNLFARRQGTQGIPASNAGPTSMPTSPNGPRPWFSQGLGGAPTYNYGYFGTHLHNDFSSRGSYYDNYWEVGQQRGY